MSQSMSHLYILGEKQIKVEGLKTKEIKIMMVNAIMMTEKEAMYVQVLSSTGMAKASIATRFGYKLMDVVNVLRGNSFSHVTGILNRNITGKEVVVVEHLLKQEHPYRDIAGYAGIDANKVRNIMGVAQFNKVI